MFINTHNEHPSFQASLQKNDTYMAGLMLASRTSTASFCRTPSPALIPLLQ